MPVRVPNSPVILLPLKLGPMRFAPVIRLRLAATRKTIRLYGFLGLKPNLGIVARDDLKDELFRVSFFCIMILVLFFVTLVWNLYVHDRFFPIESNPWQWLPSLLGTVVVGGGLCGLFTAFRKKKTRDSLLILFLPLLGGIMLGGTTFWAWGCTLNAMLDYSKPELLPVTLESREVENYMYIFRVNRVRYQFTKDAGDPSQEKTLAMSREPFAKLAAHGVAEVRKPW